MNREDIIRMAREAGFQCLLPSEHIAATGCIYDSGDDEITPLLKRFAALVASAEREFYMQLFLDPENQPTQFGTATQEYREQEVREAKQQERHEFKEHALAMAKAAIIGAVKNEREACAKVCEDLDAWNMDDPASTAIKAIRARGQA